MITRRLRDIAKQHDQLFEYCHLIETFYNPIIFLSVLSSAVNTCCCLYAMEAQVAAGNKNEISKSAFYLIVLALQIMIYCGYAETLTQSSMRVFQACTWAKWTDWNKRNKIILFIIMMRAQKEYEYTVYGMIVVNLNRLTLIANGSISYFMLLRNFG
uniref:Olfactory receptor 15 n=1 Tax=Meteorus pulchricornis TaxID=51522 RepID=A0A1S5VFK4_9HYME|nr:olfactory receptor 15 [Meteorus pulchricornis]